MEITRQVASFDLSLFKSTFLVNGYGDCQNLNERYFEQINPVGYPISSIWLKLDCIEINLGKLIGNHLQDDHHEHTIRVDYHGNLIDSKHENDLHIALAILPQLEMMTKLHHQKLEIERVQKALS